jgi:3-oxoacyl-[acyl-carrier protein] reductase
VRDRLRRAFPCIERRRHEKAPSPTPVNTSLGRIAEVEEVATLVTMLASPLMHTVNGTQIEIDGGQEKALMDRIRDRK